MMQSSRAQPPDGGYSWVVVVSAFFTMGLTAAVLKNVGLFFQEIQNHFGVLTSTTSWVASTCIAMFHIGGPVASALTLKFSQRVVIMSGGVLAASGMILASLAFNLPWLYLTMGVLQGTGISFSWIPANSMVNHYFVRWRPIAYAIASSGECVFSVAFSPFFQWLIDSYGWRDALLLIGGLQLNLCICGALMRPLETKQTPIMECKDAPAGKSTDQMNKRFQCSLLRMPELFLYIVFAIFAAAGFFILPLFLVPFSNSLGIDKYWPASILSVLALTDLVGRLFCGWLANMRMLRNLQLLAMATVMLGVTLLLLPLSQDYWGILVFSGLYGFLFGCVVAMHVISIVDIVTLDGFDIGLGLFMLFRSVGGFIGPPAAGWLVDQTSDFSNAFYFSGLCLIMSSVFVVLVDRLVQKRKLALTDCKVSEDGERML
ncbi:monocarboxylate transporter 13 isoform 1-T2 [Synchiropus picturatus]